MHWQAAGRKQTGWGSPCKHCVPASTDEALKIQLILTQQREAEVSNAASCVLCRCKPNVIGRQCDLCAPGYYHYPNCQRCDCHPAGTEASTCDPVTGQCHCKVSPSAFSRGAFLLGLSLLALAKCSAWGAMGVWWAKREPDSRSSLFRTP